MAASVSATTDQRPFIVRKRLPRNAQPDPQNFFEVLTAVGLTSIDTEYFAFYFSILC